MVKCASCREHRSHAQKRERETSGNVKHEKQPTNRERWCPWRAPFGPKPATRNQTKIRQGLEEEGGGDEKEKKVLGVAAAIRRRKCTAGFKVITQWVVPLWAYIWASQITLSKMLCKCQKIHLIRLEPKSNHLSKSSQCVHTTTTIFVIYVCNVM